MPIGKQEHRKGVAALIVLALVFASMGLFARYLATGFTTIQQVYLRLMAAFSLSLLIFAKELDFGKLAKISQKEWLLLFFRAAAIYIIGVTLFTKAINLAKYSNVSFIGALPFAALWGIILFQEKITVKRLTYIVFALFGTSLIILTDVTNFLLWGYGEIIALVSSIFFSLGYVTRKWHSDLLSNKEMTVITFFLSLTTLIALSLFTGEGIPTSWHLGLFAAVIGAGTFNVINLSLINYGFEKVEAILASNILTLESFFAVILGFLFYSELPTVKELFGGIIVIVSVIKMNQLMQEES